MREGSALQLNPLPSDDASETGPARPPRSRLDALLDRHRLRVAAALWVVLVAIYHVDDSLVEEGDAVANVELPLSLLRTGSLTFSPRHSPIIFFWKSEPPLEVRDDFYVRHWFERHAGRAAGVWYATGKLRFNGPRYFATKAPRRDAYVSTFSVLPGLSFLPIAALMNAVYPTFSQDTAWRLSMAKLYAASLIAASAVLVLLIAWRFTRPVFALLIALSYALGTCVWAIASETLWQQTLNIALLTGASYAFVRSEHTSSKPERAALAAGLLLGTAMASRPTAVFFVAAFGIYWLIHRRKVLPLFAVGLAPVLLAVALYNFYYFGSPFNFAQEMVGHTIAHEKTGREAVWQTPIVVGAFGLLLSPSRGLLVFSPFLALAFVGVVRAWKEPQYRVLRPLTIAALLTMLVQCKWFDWWGGWAYGYRPWLEAVPVLALCMLPVLPAVCSRRWSSLAFAAALGWSVFVQGLGAFAYDKYWNARDLHVVNGREGERRRLFADEAEARREAALPGHSYGGTFACNIDYLECRSRLWSLDDNIISFYLDRWPIARDNRRHLAWIEPATKP